MKTPDEIKSWLKRNHKTRAWLGDKCFVVKGTVDGWLSRGKRIPDAKMMIIEALMSETTRHSTGLSINFNDQQMELVDAFRKRFPGIDLEEYLKMKTIELTAGLTDTESIIAAAKKYGHPDSGDLYAAEDDADE